MEDKRTNIGHKSQVVSHKSLIVAQRHKGKKQRRGTAFILVVMLVTLLSVIGVMFLLRSRVERMSASAIRQEEELNSAVDSVVAAISQQLVLDTPGDVDAKGVLKQEYYDYPDPCNMWLANLEPYTPDNGANYYWQQISDVTGYLTAMGQLVWKDNATQNVPVKPPDGTYIPEYYPEKLELDNNGQLREYWADADGDGIADSKWLELTDVLNNRPFITASKGEPVYAAIRVVDNGGMLNVNTGYKFEPFVQFGKEVKASDIDGRSQMQVNFLGLSARDQKHTAAGEKEQRLLDDRNWNGDKEDYEWGVIWQYENPARPYTPFDISDELKLRNRYLLNFNEITTRIEELWTNAYDGGLEMPVDDDIALANWKQGAVLDISKTALTADDKYDFRHISTTYNIDRIINPFGERMVNIQNIDSIPNVQRLYNIAQNLYEKMLLPCMKDVPPASPLYNILLGEFAQIAANIKDYSDDDTEVTTVYENPSGEIGPHYGYERPDIRISELVYGYKYVDPNNPNAKYDPNNKIPNDPNFHRSFAIELSKDFRKDEQFNDWRLVIDSTDPNTGIGFQDIIPITSAIFDDRGGRYYVAIYQDPCAPLVDLVHWYDSPADGATGVDPNVVLCWGDIWGQDENGAWSKANAYDVYFYAVQPPYTEQEVQKMVADANSHLPVGGVYKGRQYNVNCFNPFGMSPMDLNTKYYWRIAGVNDLDHILNNKDDVIIDSGNPPWSFKTWLVEPNSIYRRIDVNTPPVFGPDSVISLERRVPGKTTYGGYMIVDMLGPTDSIDWPTGSPDDKTIPPWLFDPNDADGTRKTHSFQRDPTWQGRLRRLWDYDPSLPSLGCAPLPISQCPTLGWTNDFRWPDPLPPLQAQHWRVNNVGELGFIFKKSAYYAPDLLTAPLYINERIQINDAELDGPGNVRGIKVDLTDPSVQKMFKFLTVMDPCSHGRDANEVQGRININTAPWFVLAQLPWVSIHDNPTANYALAKAIVAYRDKQTVPSLGLDYSKRLDRWGNPANPGFENIGQLNDVNEIGTDNFASIDYFALDGKDQRGFPDLSTDRRTKVDGSRDDQEERDLIFARISDLVTVRSDVFTAYILVRLGADGPQKRVMAILDRSDVRNIGGKIVGSVKIRSLYPMPDPR